MSLDIFLIAGEVSGDLLGANLCQQIKQRYPQAQLRGMAGAKMRQAGVHALVESETMAIMGFWEVIKHLGKIKRVMRKIKLALLEKKPDVLVLIDYPGFNLRIAKFAQRHGIKVLFYVSPQIWAWRSGRIHTIKQYVDHMAVLFQFEKQIYRQAGVPVSVAGHPLRHLVPSHLNQLDCRKQLQLPQKTTIIGLMPGSRRQEIERLLPVMIDTAQQLRQRHPNAQFIIPAAQGLNPELFGDLPAYVHLINNNTYASIKACDAVICASGTATLEVSLLSVPMVLIYKVAPLSYWLGKKLIKTPFIGLCNIVAGQKVCEELIQDDANPDTITQAIERCINDNTYRDEMMHRMANTRYLLGEGSDESTLLKSITRLSGANLSDAPQQ